METAVAPINATPNPFPWIIGFGFVVGGIFFLSRSSSQRTAYSLQTRPIPLLSSLSDADQRPIIATAQAQLYALRYLPATSNVTGDLDTVTQDALRRFAQSYSDAIAIEQSRAPQNEQVILTVLDNLYRTTFGLPTG